MDPGARPRPSRDPLDGFVEAQIREHDLLPDEPRAAAIVAATPVIADGFGWLVAAAVIGALGMVVRDLWRAARDPRS